MSVPSAPEETAIPEDSMQELRAAMADAMTDEVKRAAATFSGELGADAPSPEIEPLPEKSASGYVVIVEVAGSAAPLQYLYVHKDSMEDAEAEAQSLIASLGDRTFVEFRSQEETTYVSPSRILSATARAQSDPSAAHEEPTAQRFQAYGGSQT